MVTGQQLRAAKFSYLSKYVGTVAWVCIVLWLFQWVGLLHSLEQIRR
jgi:hypothetical protein